MIQTPRTAPSLLLLLVALSLPAAPLTLTAQERAASPTSPTFDEVEVERLDASALAAKASGLKPVTLEDPAALLTPRLDGVPARFDDKARRRLIEQLQERVVVIVAVVTLPEPYAQTPLIYRGHAVWLSPHADGSSPQLISPHAWLEHAEELYIEPLEMRPDPGEPRLAERSTLPGVEGAYREFKKRKSELVRVEIGRVDSWRGLASLSVEAKGAPARGLTVLPEGTSHLGPLFGHSPLASEPLVATALRPERPEQEDYAFFFLNSYGGLLGAPVLTASGEVVMLNVMAHPSEEGLTLAIPPGALREFLEANETALEEKTLKTR